MPWQVEYSDEFGGWWDGLTEAEQDSVAFGMRLLQERGPNLKRPYADAVAESSYPNMKELRCQHEGRPYRVLSALIGTLNLSQERMQFIKSICRRSNGRKNSLEMLYSQRVRVEEIHGTQF